MVHCDMCGKEAPLSKTKIEGTIMNVCSQCSKYGERVQSTKGKRFANSRGYHAKKEKVEPEKFIVQDYAQKIKSAREQRKLKPEDLAKKINEKESLLLKVEAGHMKPNFPLAKKIEKFFNIKLIETFKESDSIIENTSSEKTTGLTMGDILKKAMKKK